MKAQRVIEPVRVELGAWWKDWLKRVTGRLQTMKYAERKWDAESLKELIELDG